MIYIGHIAYIKDVRLAPTNTEHNTTEYPTISHCARRLRKQCEGASADVVCIGGMVDFDLFSSG